LIRSVLRVVVLRVVVLRVKGRELIYGHDIFDTRA
jgi:hypothetical protein